MAQRQNDLLNIIEEILFFITLDLADFIAASILRVIITCADSIADLADEILEKPRITRLVMDRGVAPGGLARLHGDIGAVSGGGGCVRWSLCAAPGRAGLNKAKRYKHLCPRSCRRGG